MAQWTKKVNEMAQSAIARGKEAAELNRLNSQIRAQEQTINAELTVLGRYITEHLQLLQERDGVICGILERIEEANARIAELNGEILALRGVWKCEKCGAEVSRESRFCGSCGTPNTPELPERSCQACGAAVEADTVFCGSCGAKIS